MILFVEKPKLEMSYLVIGLDNNFWITKKFKIINQLNVIIN